MKSQVNPDDYMDPVCIFSVKKIARVCTLVYFIGFLLGYLTRYFTS
jgi:hypothetical protein